MNIRNFHCKTCDLDLNFDIGEIQKFNLRDCFLQWRRSRFALSVVKR